MTESVPIPTLYCNRIQTKIKKEILIDLLFEFFIPYGMILDIVVKGGKANRGQAFIVFENTISATNAKRSLNKQLFLGHPINIEYAKTKSDTTSRLDGTYKYKLHQKRSMTQLGVTIDPQKDFELQDQGEYAVLVLKQLPPSITSEALHVLFSQYQGFINTEIITDKKMGIVRFTDSGQAQIASEGLQGFKITPTHAIQIDTSKLDSTNAV